MTTVVVAEKPSVARDIARVLGATRRAEGYLEGHGYRVTWAVGHLIHFAEPDDYGPSWKGRWALTQLPMVPADWRLKTAPTTVKQFRIVRELINAGDCSEVVCATDAGREGEHIFRLIYEHAHCRKPVRRLWVSSLTDEAIRDGFRRLRPGSDYDDLGRAARARAQADWLVGMNLTRAYTVHNRVLCTIGRVQTPALAMIVARDALVAGFVKALFYELVARLAEGFPARYSRDGETRIDDRAQAERLQARLKPHPTGTVTAVDKRLVHNRPPPFYDLTTLQRDANRRFGLTAAQVLEHAQALYETHKLISYPRTESRHISEDMVAQLPGILSRLDHPQAAEALARLRGGHRLSKAYVDSTKLTDHHAIIPTDKPAPEGLGGPVRRVYELVVARFVGVFLADQAIEETLIAIDIGGGTFVARGTLVLEEGWKRGEPGPGFGPSEGAADGTESPASPLPALTAGQTVHVESLDVVEKETQPPRPFTDATLLAAMKGAGRDIEDQVLARAMKGSGLGTPATRAEIIEKLIRTGYVERERKQLRATPKGRALVALVAEPLRSPGLTAAWEQQLKEVEEGTREAANFYRDIVSFVADLIPRIVAGPAMTADQRAAARSGGARAGGREAHVRGNASRGQAGRASANQNDGPAAEQGGSARAAAPLREETSADANPPPPTCPRCGLGHIIEGRRGFGCDRYREGCTFVVWKEIGGKVLTQAQLRDLIQKGRTRPIRGLLDAAGACFDGRLRLDRDQQVMVERLVKGD